MKWKSGCRGWFKGTLAVDTVSSDLPGMKVYSLISERQEMKGAYSEEEHEALGRNRHGTSMVES